VRYIKRRYDDSFLILFLDNLQKNGLILVADSCYRGNLWRYDVQSGRRGWFTGRNPLLESMSYNWKSEPWEWI